MPAWIETLGILLRQLSRLADTRAEVELAQKGRVGAWLDHCAVLCGPTPPVLQPAPGVLLWLNLVLFLQAPIEEPEFWVIFKDVKMPEPEPRFLTACKNAIKKPSAGYEPWLIEQGMQPFCARLIAHLVVHHGKRRAREAEARRAVVAAIRFLAKPGRRKKSALRRIKLLFAEWEASTVVDELLNEVGPGAAGFTEALRSAAAGDAPAFQRLTEIAASIAPRLPHCRGRSISAASAAHEFFLDGSITRRRKSGGSAYTWNDEQRRFTDKMTEATCREFGAAWFDPRPALRRLKAKGPRSA